MKILLDTHILLWALSNDARLEVKARRLIESEENEKLPECTTIHPGYYSERFIIYVANPAYCVI